jgi:U3 small nucleolar RNA-associated protein 13
MDAFGEDKGGYTSLHLTNLSTTHLSPLLVAVDAEHNMTFLKMSWGQNQSGGEVLQIKTDRSIVGDNGEILDMAVIPGSSKDRHTIAVATNSAQIRIFGLADANKDEIGNDEATENPTHSALSPRGLLDGHTAIVLAINASPCGRYLATASKDKTVRVWHLASRRCIGLATGHTEAVGSVALSNKAGCYDVGGKSAESGAGAFVATASKDRTLKVWPLPGSAVLNKSAANGEELPLRARLSARAHEKDINIVSVAPNDSLIATGSQDKTVKLWRPTDLALHATLKGHKRGIWDCQFSKTDRVLATSSGDKTIKLWSIADSSCVRTFQVRKSIQFAQFE